MGGRVRRPDGDDLLAFRRLELLEVDLTVIIHSYSLDAFFELLLPVFASRQRLGKLW